MYARVYETLERLKVPHLPQKLWYICTHELAEVYVPNAEMAQSIRFTVGQKLSFIRISVFSTETMLAL